MMAYYYVKQDLPGLPKGNVERFSIGRASTWKSEDAIEDFDPKNPKHIKAHGAEDALAHLKAKKAHEDELAELARKGA